LPKNVEREREREHEREDEKILSNPIDVEGMKYKKVARSLSTSDPFAGAGV
jgi:hypothetical protein